MTQTRYARVPITAVSLLLATLAMALSWAPAAGQASPEPELTWAPLVTPPPINEPFVTTPQELADGFALGAADAPVIVEVWEDFQCPFCQRFTFQIEPAIIEQYVEPGDVRLVFRNLAFLGDESHWAAVASSLAAEQNLFWPLHDYMFSNLMGEQRGSYSLERLLEMAERAGLDMEAFRAGLVLEAARERFAEIQEESQRDATALGVNATPTVVVNGVPLQAPDLATVAAAIDVALSQAGTTGTDSGEGDTEDTQDGAGGDEAAG